MFKMKEKIRIKDRKVYLKKIINNQDYVMHYGSKVVDRYNICYNINIIAKPFFT